MASQSSGSGIDRRVLRNISFQASRLHRHNAIPGLSAEDIEQELLLDLLVRSDAYDPARAAFTTFADRIVTHRIADLVRPSVRLTGERATRSIDDERRPDGLPLIEILPDRAPPLDEDVGLRLDLTRFADGLAPP